MLTEDCPFSLVFANIWKSSVRLRLPPLLHHRHPFRRANRFALGASVGKGGVGLSRLIHTLSLKPR